MILLNFKELIYSDENWKSNDWGVDFTGSVQR